jgi:hypothetical protein
LTVDNYSAYVREREIERAATPTAKVADNACGGNFLANAAVKNHVGDAATALVLLAPTEEYLALWALAFASRKPCYPAALALSRAPNAPAALALSRAPNVLAANASRPGWIPFATTTNALVSAPFTIATYASLPRVLVAATLRAGADFALAAAALAAL